MRRAVNRITGPIAAAIPLWGYQRLFPRETIGVFYHLVSDETVAHVKHLYPHRSVADFERDLVYLKEHYPLLTYQELADPGDKGRMWRKPGVFLSFDDGFVECFSIVSPLLRKYEIPCSFFVTTNFIDNRAMYYRNQVSLCIERVLQAVQDETVELLESLNRSFGLSLNSEEAFVTWVKGLNDEEQIAGVCERLGVDIAGYLQSRQPYLTSEQIKGLAGEGFTIGAHSRRHQKLARLDEAGIEAEIAESCAIVQQLTASKQVPFSFPNSAFGLDRDLLARVRAKHEHVGLYFDTKDLSRDRAFIVNRIWVEAPKFNQGGSLPMASILRNAYQAYFLEAVRRGGSSVLKRQSDDQEPSHSGMEP